MKHFDTSDNRNRWRLGLAEDLWSDLCYARRMLVKFPGFTLGAVAILALTIGANTILFAFFSAYLLSPLPVTDPQRNVELKAEQMRGYRRDLWSYADFSLFRSNNSAFESMYAYALVELPAREPSPQKLKGFLVSGNFFRLFRTRMILGRAFGPEEDEVPGRDAVVVLSHHAWRTIFNGDPQIAGKTIRIRQTAFTIIGVTEPGFAGLDPFITPDVWAPIVMRDQLVIDGRRLDDPENTCLVVAGLVKTGLSLVQAEESMRGQIRALNAGRLAAASVREMKLIPRRTYIPLVGEVLAAVIFVFAGMVLLLLIACANLAGILLARGAARQREMAIRASLGAPRGRQVRQLLTESIVLSAIAAVPSILLAQSGTTYIQQLIFTVVTQDGYYVRPVSPDWRVFFFITVLALCAGILLGLLPALETTRIDLVDALKDGPGGCSGARSRRAREWLIVGQVAASLVLLVITGIFMRAAQRVSRVDPGFEVDHVFSIRVEGPKRRLIEQLKVDPRVEMVSEVYRAPLDAHGLVKIPASVEDRVMAVGSNYVDSQYFETLGIAVVRGRHFSVLEVRTSAPVAVISEATARFLWPREDPIGKTITVVDPSMLGYDPRAVHWVAGKYEVIGVAADVVSSVWSGRKDSTAVYLPAVQDDPRNVHLLVRSRDASPVTIAAIKKICSEADGTTAGEPIPLRETAARLRLPFVAASGVSLGIGSLALIMTCIGLYGVVAFGVVQRTREIGIRIALGAPSLRIVGSIVRGAILRVALGIAFGIPLCIVFSKVAASVFLQVDSFDPVAYIMTPLFLASVTFVAAYAPARRATRIDPASAFRRQ
jgi:macrolide transport system ATP-binding/permease protein